MANNVCVVAFIIYVPGLLTNINKYMMVKLLFNFRLVYCKNCAEYLYVALSLAVCIYDMFEFSLYVPKIFLK